MQRHSMIGILAAVFAAFAWSLNFVAPYVVGPYSIYDLALIRFLLSGLLGIALFFAIRTKNNQLCTRDWLVTAWLGLVGYVGYFITVMAAVLFAGPIIPPAIVAMVPVVLAMLSNISEKTVLWRKLSIPLGFLTLGLGLINLSGMAEALSGMSTRVALGVAISVGAVLLWTVFALTNRTALAARPTMDARMWTAMMMIGGAVETLVLVPLAESIGLLHLTTVGIHWNEFVPLLLGSFILALVGSIAGSWAWTIAAKRIPVGLAGQLIVTETVFAVLFGLGATHRWPTWFELLGVSSIVIGVVSALKIFRAPSSEGQISDDGIRGVACLANRINGRH